MRRIAVIAICAALAGSLCHPVQAQPWRAIGPRIHKYCTDRGPTRDLSVLTNDSCKAVAGIDSTVLAYMKQYSLVGAQLAVMRGDSLLYAKGYGWADRESGIRMQPCNRMRIASVSKLMTSIGIMKLYEQGFLSLEDRPFDKGGVLEKYAVRMRDQRIKDITIEQLLRHKGGFTAPGDDPMFVVGMLDGREALRKEIAGTMLGYTPGESQEYSNLGYFALSLVIEETTGQKYADWMQHNVFYPCQCHSFAIGGNFLCDRLDREVRYYMYQGARLERDFRGGSAPECPCCYGGNNVTGLEGAGAWTTTAPELCRIIAAIDNDRSIRDLLSESTVQRMTEETDSVSYSIGWSDTNHVGIWTRTGYFGGTSAIVKNYSWDGDCWVFITNTSTRFRSRFSKKSAQLIMSLREHYLNQLPSRDLFH